MYFDLACEKHPDEPGYYWAGFVDTRAPFELVPLDVFKNADHDGMGRAVPAAALADRQRLTEQGARHILGIQGQLWAENLRSPAMLEYMAFPRIIALAERAWAKSPAWAEIDDAAERRRQIDKDWNQFANRLGQIELPRLDFLAGGVQYRLPPPGVVIRDGAVHANVELPGLAIRYTTDGSEPDALGALVQVANSSARDDQIQGVRHPWPRRPDGNGRDTRSEIATLRSINYLADVIACWRS